MSLNDPRISVIIPHLNQPEALEACLASLQAQDLEAGSYEIIVVDNGSAAPPHAIVGRHPNARLLYEPQPGPGPARNAGARSARGAIFAFIDADCRAHPGWLSNALQRLESAPENVILGGDVRIWHDNHAPPSPVEAYESVFAYRFRLYIERHGFCGTGNLVVRRNSFEAIGPFAGIQHAEDMEWGARALRAGFRFQYVPEMIVYHPARRSLGELYEKWDRHTQHFRNLAATKPPWRLRWTIRALMILISPIPDSVKVLASDRLHGPSERWNAISVLVRVRAHRAWTMLRLLRQSGDPIVWNRGTAVPSVPPPE